MRGNPHDHPTVPITPYSYRIGSSCRVHHLDYYMLIGKFDSERDKRMRITIELADEHIVVKMVNPTRRSSGVRVRGKGRVIVWILPEATVSSLLVAPLPAGPRVRSVEQAVRASAKLETFWEKVVLKEKAL